MGMGFTPYNDLLEKLNNTNINIFYEAIKQVKDDNFLSDSMICSNDIFVFLTIDQPQMFVPIIMVSQPHFD
jgi:hypothetical protein